MKITHLRDYREARRSEYPEIGDQLDAIWDALRGQKLPNETKDVLDKIDAIKSKYPKASGSK